MEKLDKKNILYIGGSIASVVALMWLWAKRSASSAAAAQQAADQSGGIDPATAAYEAAVGSGSLGSAPTSYGASTPLSSGISSGSDLATSLPALITALGLGPTVPVTAPTTDYSSQIAALYQADLGRVPDTQGEQFYNAYLNSGGTLAQTAKFISNSPEAESYSANQKTIADTNLITNDYQTLLGRLPDASGLSTYLGALASGTSADTITTWITNSPEYKDLHSSHTVATAAASNLISTPAAAQPGAAVQVSQPTPIQTVTTTKGKPSNLTPITGARLLAG